MFHLPLPGTAKIEQSVHSWKDNSMPALLPSAVISQGIHDAASGVSARNIYIQDGGTSCFNSNARELGDFRRAPAYLEPSLSGHRS